jgi:hypothetical protein
MGDANGFGLRGGWVVTPLPDGRVRHARRFGSPRTLDPTESVFLCGTDVPVATVVTVNGQVLGTAAGPFAFDITGRLLPRNEVWLDVDAIGEVGEVTLEFRPE